MIRDVLLAVNEALFWVQGGEMLINTPWFFVWVIVGCCLMLLPLWLVASGKITSRYWHVPVTVVWMSGLLFIVISPGAVQMQLMQECRDIQTEVKGQTIDLRECRHKENYYEDFGDWKVYK